MVHDGAIYRLPPHFLASCLLVTMWCPRDFAVESKWGYHIQRNNGLTRISVTFTINIPPILACLPYMDPMGNSVWIGECYTWRLIFSSTCMYTLQASISKSMNMTNSKKHALDGRTYHKIPNRFQPGTCQDQWGLISIFPLLYTPIWIRFCHSSLQNANELLVQCIIPCGGNSQFLEDFSIKTYVHL